MIASIFVENYMFLFAVLLWFGVGRNDSKAILDNMTYVYIFLGVEILWTWIRPAVYFLKPSVEIGIWPALFGSLFEFAKILFEGWFTYVLSDMFKTEFCEWYWLLIAVFPFIPFLISSVVANNFITIFLFGIGGISSM